MADSDLQALLDPDYLLVRRSNYAAGEPPALITSYYCSGRTLGHAKAGWTDITTASTDAQKNTAIRAALQVG